MPTAVRWQQYVRAADEWALAYAALPPTLFIVAPPVFATGHALELYLKAAWLKHHELLPRRTHNLLSLWADAKHWGAGHFVPEIELNHTILLAYTKSPLAPTTWLREHGSSDVIQEHAERHELYLALHAVVDLKYFPAPTTSIPQDSWGAVFPNPLWADLFGALRRYLAVAADRTGVDLLAHTASNDAVELPAAGRAFLTRLAGRSQAYPE